VQEVVLLIEPWLQNPSGQTQAQEDPGTLGAVQTEAEQLQLQSVGFVTPPFTQRPEGQTQEQLVEKPFGEVHAVAVEQLQTHSSSELMYKLPPPTQDPGHAAVILAKRYP
jgi:hypothetical protein